MGEGLGNLAFHAMRVGWFLRQTGGYLSRSLSQHQEHTNSGECLGLFIFYYLFEFKKKNVFIYFR